MVTSILIAKHSTNEGVLCSNSACSMLMSDDLRLPRQGIKPRPSEFRGIGSTARPSPLPIESVSSQKLLNSIILRYLRTSHQKSLHWLKITRCIRYKILSLSHKSLQYNKFMIFPCTTNSFYSLIYSLSFSDVIFSNPFSSLTHCLLNFTSSWKLTFFFITILTSTGLAPWTFDPACLCHSILGRYKHRKGPKRNRKGLKST